MRIAGVYEYLRYDTPVGSLRRDFWGASGTIVAGPGTIYLFAGRGGDGRAPASVRVGGLASGPDTAAWQYVLSYTYSLSGRTMVYAGYVRVDNDDSSFSHVKERAVLQQHPVRRVAVRQGLDDPRRLGLYLPEELRLKPIP